MSETIDPRYSDKRTAERYIKSGQLDEKVWEKHIKTLPDVAEKGEPVEANLSDLDDDFEDDDTEE
jgi:hypothetical protein